MPNLPTTQRAYTLRLRAVPSTDEVTNKERRKVIADALWATHEAVNAGAKVFGDWLLTLRGGLDHELAGEYVKATKKKPARKPNQDEIQNRRVLLALSWLSVESEPKPSDRHFKFVVANAREDSPATRTEKVTQALRRILTKRGVFGSEQDGWIDHCSAAFEADIRDDAVWVDRSAMFDDVAANWELAKARLDAKTLLWFILKDDYLSLPVVKKAAKKEEPQEGEGEPDDEGAERKQAVTKSSKGAAQRTRHPFSHLFGEGKPFGKNPSRSLSQRELWVKHLKPLIEASGITLRPIPKKDEKPKEKGKKKPKDGGVAQTELHREMFSKAASRLAQLWTKQRQQEADRIVRKEADKVLKEMEANPVFADALKALKSYCIGFRNDTNATNEIRIRPKQIIEWETVVKRWAKISESPEQTAKDQRIQAVKDLQDADLDKKFGDPNLFFRLAADEYRDVWWHVDEANHTILENYVKGMKARSDARLKVASYRHPDGYRNPVFCQFGVSRPAIAFRRLKAFTDDPAGDDVRAIGMLLWHPQVKLAKLTVMHAVSQRFDREIGAACDVVQRDGVALPVVTRHGRLGAAAVGLPSAETPSKVGGVFDLKPVSRRSSDDDDEDEEVSDNSKLKEPKWNGTLSTNRRDLVSIRNLLDRAERAEKERDSVKALELRTRAQTHRNQLRWTVTVSTELEGRGPWYKFIEESDDQTSFKRTVRKSEDKEDGKRIGDTFVSWDGWPWEEINKPLKLKEKKKGQPADDDEEEKPELVEDKSRAHGFHARLVLCRLPGLRLLSVDLGHRFAAACAVWVTLSLQKLAEEIKGRKIVAGGTGDDQLYLQTEHTDAKGKRRVTIYRRIGPNKLGEQQHPAPWAKLERSFLIKLQGEEKPVRAASKHGPHSEVGQVKSFADRLGLDTNDDDEKGCAVDALMSRAVRIATLGLRRHARRAKIAYAFDPKTNTTYGIGGKPTIFQHGDDAYIKLLTDALFDWHALATETKWNDSAAWSLWNDHVAKVAAEWKLTEPKHDPNAIDERTRKQQRDADDALRDQLKKVAEQLASSENQTLRSTIHSAWDSRWKQDDGAERQEADFTHELSKDAKGRTRSKTTAKRETAGWHSDIRWITDWIMGWHLIDASSEKWTRNVGGLSVTRIATMKSLYQLHKAFAMRPKPDIPRGSPEKGEAGVAQAILDAMERMREQRVKQLASRIVASALGLGGHWKEREIPKRDTAGKRQLDADGKVMMKKIWVWQEEASAKYDACHAVVIESLRNYRPDELQTRRENQQLMNWSAGKVRKYLEESCQLHGLHLREVMPNYTSRQDGRTGLPGCRCVDVPVEGIGGFLTASWWQKKVKAAEKRRAKPTREQPYDAEHQLLFDLNAHLMKLEADGKRLPRVVRLLRAGGDLFVSTNGSAKRVSQADLNAAANIGMRALLDPDFPGKWWYVPCNENKETGIALPSDKVKGSACFGDDPSQFGSLSTPKKANEQAADKESKSKKASSRKKQNADGSEPTNFWCDPSANALRNAQNKGRWWPTPVYWKFVREDVVAILRAFNGLPPSPKSAR